MSNQQKVNILEVLGLLGKQQPETKSSRALDRVPKHCQDLFKGGQMPIPEFETVERPVRKQAEQPQPSRHPKRELKPGYRWKFNGTGAFGRKLFIQVPIEDPVADQINRAENQSHTMVEEYFDFAAKEDSGLTRDTFKAKGSNSLGRFTDTGRIVAVENADQFDSWPDILVTFHSYYGFEDGDLGRDRGIAQDTHSLLAEVKTLSKRYGNNDFPPSVSYVKNGAITTVLITQKDFSALKGALMQMPGGGFHGKDIIVTDDLMHLIINRKI